jgi:hypothetical protein
MALIQFTSSILLSIAIAPSILNPVITPRSENAIASVTTANAIAINTDKKLLNKFKVNGIGLSASKISIIRAFGKPIKIERVNSSNSPCLRGDKYEALHYRGAEFHLLNDSLMIANFTTSKYKTESGIRVGDRISSVKAKYAKYGRNYKSSGSRIDIKPLNFWSKNGLIKQISLAEFDDLC